MRKTLLRGRALRVGAIAVAALGCAAGVAMGTTALVRTSTTAIQACEGKNGGLRIVDVPALRVPGLDAQRHLVILEEIPV